MSVATVGFKDWMVEFHELKMINWSPKCITWNSTSGQ